MTATLAPLDELETSNLACFWAGVRAATRMATAIDTDGMAADRLTDLVGTNAADEIARTLTEILLRADKPRPPAEPTPPVRIPPPPGWEAVVSETIHEVAMQELAERIVEANQRDARLAQTDPRNGDQQGARR